MNKLIDHTFNYLRFALLGIATAVIVLGPTAYAQNHAQIDMPSTAYHGSANFAQYSCYLSSDYTTIMRSGIIRGLGGTSPSSSNYFMCVIENSANCNLVQGTICTVASGILVTALYLLASKAAAAAIASQIALKLGAKKSVKKLIEKLRTIIISWGITTIEVAGETITIPWHLLATLLDNDSTLSKVVDFIMLNDYSKAKRLCKCFIC